MSAIISFSGAMGAYGLTCLVLEWASELSKEQLQRVIGTLGERREKLDLEAVRHREVELVRELEKEQWGWLGAWVNPMKDDVLEMFDAGAVRARRTRAEGDMVFLTLVLIQFSRDHGTLPGRLEELIPDYLSVVPNDPFSSEAYRYENSGESIVIYSVGPNGVDDGGQPGEWDTEQREFLGDMVMERDLNGRE